jgi:hypothetical protein
MLLQEPRELGAKLSFFVLADLPQWFPAIPSPPLGGAETLASIAR